ncbi:hypothetical protein ACNF49_38310 [Actinomadura sp. ATCC 39365]
MNLSTSEPRPANAALLIPAQRGACQPWCVEHDRTEGVCQSGDIPTPAGQWSSPGRIAVSHEPTGGTLLTLQLDPDNEYTPEEFEQLAALMLVHAAKARGVVLDKVSA